MVIPLYSAAKGQGNDALCAAPRLDGVFASHHTSSNCGLLGAMTATPVAVAEYVDVLRRVLENESNLKSGLCLEVLTCSLKVCILTSLGALMSRHLHGLLDVHNV